jgi:hypothetical protein
VAVRVPDQSPQPPSTADAPYPIEVVHDGWRLGADTPEELVGLIIDGYADLADEQAQLQARAHLAVSARTMVQTLLNAGEQFDLCTEAEQRVLLDRASAPAVGKWECAIPLVLVSVLYRPVGNLPQPHVVPPGQVWWIDPSSASSLLETLHQVRWLDLVRADGLEPVTAAYRDLGVNGAAGYWSRSVAE